MYQAAFVAHLPLLAEWAKNMWNKDHYQFFPLLLGFVGWRLVQCWQKPLTPPHQSVGAWPGILLLLDLLLLGLSALAFSPFLIIPALMVLIASAFLAHQGWGGFWRAAPAWLLLIFIVPLPLNWDTRLIQNMQFVVSQLASWMLDAVGQIHFREGVVLVTPQNNFLAEEACSGIRSLFSSLTVMAIYGVTRAYSLQRQLFNQLQTVLWVIAGNGIRVAIIILVADHWTMAIAQGTAHEVLGLVVFVIIFLLALSTDRIWNLFHEREVLA